MIKTTMTDDDAKDRLDKFLDAEDYALAVHEAGHAVVADALGAKVVSVEMFSTGGGKTDCEVFADDVKNLAVCVAGCRAEHALKARTPRSGKKSDFDTMRKLLSRFPEAERRAARAEGYRLANVKLQANADVLSRIAGALFARRFSAVARIEGNELAELLAGVSV
jgi:hypothetical protein